MKTKLTSIAVGLFASATSINASAQEIVDLDNDGVITVEEVQAARDAAKAEILARFDTDGDGELSDEERDAARDARRADAIVQFDADSDGELSREERQVAREERRAEFQASFDLDNSGDLSDTEQANLAEVAQATGGRDGGRRGRRR